MAEVIGYWVTSAIEASSGPLLTDGCLDTRAVVARRGVWLGTTDGHPVADRSGPVRAHGERYAPPFASRETGDRARDVTGLEEAAVRHARRAQRAEGRERHR